MLRLPFLWDYEHVGAHQSLVVASIGDRSQGDDQEGLCRARGPVAAGALPVGLRAFFVRVARCLGEPPLGFDTSPRFLALFGRCPQQRNAVESGRRREEFLIPDN